MVQNPILQKYRRLQQEARKRADTKKPKPKPKKTSTKKPSKPKSKPKSKSRSKPKPKKKSTRSKPKPKPKTFKTSSFNLPSGLEGTKLGEAIRDVSQPAPPPKKEVVGPPAPSRSKPKRRTTPSKKPSKPKPVIETPLEKVKRRIEEQSGIKIPETKEEAQRQREITKISKKAPAAMTTKGKRDWAKRQLKKERDIPKEPEPTAPTELTPIERGLSQTRPELTKMMYEKRTGKDLVEPGADGAKTKTISPPFGYESAVDTARETSTDIEEQPSDEVETEADEVSFTPDMMARPWEQAPVVGEQLYNQRMTDIAKTEAEEETARWLEEQVINKPVNPDQTMIVTWEDDQGKTHRVRTNNLSSLEKDLDEQGAKIIQIEQDNEVKYKIPESSKIQEKYTEEIGEEWSKVAPPPIEKPKEMSNKKWNSLINKYRTGEISPQEFVVETQAETKPDYYQFVPKDDYKEVMSKYQAGEISQEEASNLLEELNTAGRVEAYQSGKERQVKRWGEEYLQFEDPAVSNYRNQVQSAIDMSGGMVGIGISPAAQTSKNWLKSQAEQYGINPNLPPSQLREKLVSAFESEVTGGEPAKFKKIKETEPAAELEFDPETGDYKIGMDYKKVQQEEWEELGDIGRQVSVGDVAGTFIPGVGLVSAVKRGVTGEGLGPSASVGQWTKGTLDVGTQFPHAITTAAGYGYRSLVGEDQPSYQEQLQRKVYRGSYGISQAARKGHEKGEWTPYLSKTVGLESPFTTQVLLPAAGGAALGALAPTAGAAAGRAGSALAARSTLASRIAGGLQTAGKAAPWLGKAAQYGTVGGLVYGPSVPTAIAESRGEVAPGTTAERLAGSTLGLGSFMAGTGATSGIGQRAAERYMTSRGYVRSPTTGKWVQDPYGLRKTSPETLKWMGKAKQPGTSLEIGGKPLTKYQQQMFTRGWQSYGQPRISGAKFAQYRAGITPSQLKLTGKVTQPTTPAVVGQQPTVTPRLGYGRAPPAWGSIEAQVPGAPSRGIIPSSKAIQVARSPTPTIQTKIYQQPFTGNFWRRGTPIRGKTGAEKREVVKRLFDIDTGKQTALTDFAPSKTTSYLKPAEGGIPSKVPTSGGEYKYMKEPGAELSGGELPSVRRPTGLTRKPITEAGGEAYKPLSSPKIRKDLSRRIQTGGEKTDIKPLVEGEKTSFFIGDKPKSWIQLTKGITKKTPLKFTRPKPETKPVSGSEQVSVVKEKPVTTTKKVTERTYPKRQTVPESWKGVYDVPQRASYWRQEMPIQRGGRTSMFPGTQARPPVPGTISRGGWADVGGIRPQPLTGTRPGKTPIGERTRRGKGKTSTEERRKGIGTSDRETEGMLYQPLIGSQPMTGTTPTTDVTPEFDTAQDIDYETEYDTEIDTDYDYEEGEPGEPGPPEPTPPRRGARIGPGGLGVQRGQGQLRRGGGFAGRFGRSSGYKEREHRVPGYLESLRASRQRMSSQPRRSVAKKPSYIKLV